MFPGLRHHPFVGSDNEQGQVDSTYASQHVLYKVLMPGDINDTYFLPARQLQPGEAEVDGQAPLLFLSQPVGVYPRQGVHQYRLAVIYMTCGAEYKHVIPALLVAG